MKITTAFFLSLFLLLSFSSVFADCSFDSSSTIGNMLTDDCKPKGSVTGDGYTIIGGVKTKVVRITNQIILGGSILSVGGIILASILYVTSFGEEEKIKKAKETLKFSIMGFAVMLLSFPIVNAIINLIYGVSGS